MNEGSGTAKRVDALDLHRRALVVDLHTDSLLAARALGLDLSRRHRPPAGFRPWMLHADVPRLREGGLDAVFLGIVTHPWPRRAYERALERISYAHYVVEKNAADLVMAGTPEEILEAKRDGKVAVALGIEGMHMLGGRPGRIEELYRRGVRYITMTHFTSNRFAVSCADFRRGEVSLGMPGREAVREMNRLGMMIDVAHAHSRIVAEVCALSSGPVIASHSAARALMPISRNMSDDDIRAVASTGGVIGLMYATSLIAPPRSDPSLDVVVDHADHVSSLVGIEHLALGSDWDGFIKTPRGMRDAADLPALTRLLLERGYSAADVEKILGGNFLRAFGEVAAAAR